MNIREVKIVMYVSVFMALVFGLSLVAGAFYYGEARGELKAKVESEKILSQHYYPPAQPEQ